MHSYLAHNNKIIYEIGQDKVLPEDSACFEGTEEFITKSIEEISKCSRKKIFGRGNLFFASFLLLVLWYVISLPLAINSCLLCKALISLRYH